MMIKELPSSSSGGGARRKRSTKTRKAAKRGGAGESDAKIWYVDKTGNKQVYGAYSSEDMRLYPSSYSDANLNKCNLDNNNTYSPIPTIMDDVFYHDGTYAYNATNQCRYTYAAERIKRYAPDASTLAQNPNGDVLAMCNNAHKNDCFRTGELADQTASANKWNTGTDYADGARCTLQAGGKAKKNARKAVAGSPVVKWASVKGKKALMKDGKKRSLYTCPSSKELRIRRMVLRNGEKKATYVKWLGQVVRC